MKALPLLLLLAATAPLAAPPLEEARASAAEARAQVDQLRRQQLALRGELGALSGHIEALKGAGGRADGTALDAALKQSQALSTSLTGLAQALAMAERRAEQAHLALLGALSGELVRLRGLFDATPERARRAELLTRMRAVRAEQERIRLALPPALLPPLPASAATGDDPEDLLEQADALRDSEDRVRQRLRQVEARLREAREERELLRRMDDFLGAEAMFDEQDRRLRLSGAGLARGGGASAPDSESSAPPPAGAPVPTTGDAAPAPPPAYTPVPSESPAPVLREGAASAAGGDRRPQVGQLRRAGLGALEAADVESLEALRRRLEDHARMLGERAATLERRARELE